MADPIVGDPAIDEEFTATYKQFKRLCKQNTLKNCSQKVLRDVKCEMQHNLADIDKYLDIRNEQGRGGLKSSIAAIAKIVK